MVAPGIIMFLSYIIMIIVFFMGLSAMSNPFGSPIGGLLTAFLGPVFVRIYAEFILLLFKLFESVRNIEKKLESTSTVKSA